MDLKRSFGLVCIPGYPWPDLSASSEFQGVARPKKGPPCESGGLPYGN